MIFAYVVLSFLFALFGTFPTRWCLDAAHAHAKPIQHTSVLTVIMHAGGADAYYGPKITYNGPLANLKTGGGITWWNSNGLYSTVHPDPSMCNGQHLGECEVCDTSNGYETVRIVSLAKPVLCKPGSDN